MIRFLALFVIWEEITGQDSWHTHSLRAATRGKYLAGHLPLGLRKLDLFIEILTRDYRESRESRW